MFKRVMPISTVLLILVSCGTGSRVAMPIVPRDTLPNRAAAQELPQIEMKVPRQDHALIDFLLQHNASLQVEMYQRDAAGVHVQGVGQIPPTMIKMSPIGDMVETAGGEMLGAIGIEQPFPALGVLKNQRLIARKQLSMQEASLDALKIRLVRDMRLQVLQRQNSVEVLRIIDENIATITSIRDVVNARIAVGGAERSQLLEVKMMLSQLAQSKQQWQAQRLDAEARLRLSLGIPSHVALPDAFLLYVLAEPIETEKAMQQIHMQHPQLRMALAKQEAALFKEHLTQADGRPAFSVGFQYTMIDDDGLSPVANGDDVWSVQIGLRVPLDRGAVAARRSEAALNYYKEQWNTEATQQRLDQEFLTGLSLSDSAAERWRLSKEEILPDSRERFELLKSGYETSKASYVEVMDAWRQVLQAEIQERQLFHGQLEKQYQLLSQMGLLFWPTLGMESEHE